MNNVIQDAVFSFIFEPLEAATKYGKEMCFSDGRVWQRFPVLAAWISDYAGNETLHGLKRMSCVVSEVPLDRLWWDTKRPHPVQNYEKYAAVMERYVNTDGEHSVASLLTVRVKIGRKVFTVLLCVEISHLFESDILHNIYLELFKHLMQGIEDFIKQHGRQELFDNLWKYLSPYPGFSMPQKAYRKVTNWQGKKMWNLGHSILGVFPLSLQSPMQAQKCPLGNAIQCVTALVDFTLVAQYQSYTKNTLEYIEQYLHDFHRYKVVFQVFWSTKKTR